MFSALSSAEECFGVGDCDHVSCPESNYELECHNRQCTCTQGKIIYVIVIFCAELFGYSNNKTMFYIIIQIPYLAYMKEYSFENQRIWVTVDIFDKLCRMRFNLKGAMP